MLNMETWCVCMLDEVSLGLLPPSAAVLIRRQTVLCVLCKFEGVIFSAEENSCSSSDAVWMNREQSVPTPVMMHSPHLTSTVLRDPKKMRPEDSYTPTFSMPAEQHPHQALPLQQHLLHQHQAAIDYKYKNIC